MDRGGSTSESLVNLMSTRGTSDLCDLPDDVSYDEWQLWLLFLLANG